MYFLMVLSVGLLMFQLPCLPPVVLDMDEDARAIKFDI